ncbi:MAG: UDP-3-O-(3-hydroxymyristoyl)glucosamine N-acyltransferase, partial [Planctomycetota bacterium]
LGGQVGITGHVEIPDDVRIAAKAGVASSLKKPGAYSGYVAREHGATLREMIELRRLGQLVERVQRLEERAEEIEQRLS